jgi:hypothetical protein
LEKDVSIVLAEEVGQVDDTGRLAAMQLDGITKGNHSFQSDSGES